MKSSSAKIAAGFLGIVTAVPPGLYAQQKVAPIAQPYSGLAPLAAPAASIMDPIPLYGNPMAHGPIGSWFIASVSPQSLVKPAVAQPGGHAVKPVPLAGRASAKSPILDRLVPAAQAMTKDVAGAQLDKASVELKAAFDLGAPGEGATAGGEIDLSDKGFSETIIPEDRAEWAAMKEGEPVHAFALLDGSKLNAAMRAALEKGTSEKALYRDDSPIHALARKTLARIEETAKGLEKSGLTWAAWYNFSAFGSTLLVEFAGSKGQVVQALGKAEIAKAWLGKDAESLPGNHLLMRDKGAYRNAAVGVSTVYLRRGVEKGHKAGPGQIDLKDSGEFLPVYFEKVEETPYSKVDADVLNGLAAGLTWKEMFSTMRSYYPDFAADDMVTVIRYRRR